MPDTALERPAASACGSSARSWWPSPAAPTPPSSRGWPTTPWGPTERLAVTAVSPSLPAAERDECAALAESWGMSWQEVTTDELDNPDYAPQRR